LANLPAFQALKLLTDYETLPLVVIEASKDCAARPAVHKGSGGSAKIGA
jgi:hypothetical protein